MSNPIWRRWIDALRGRRRRREPAALRDETMSGLVQAILSTREDEIDCDRCFEELDRYVERALQSGAAAQAEYPLVQDHLARCPDCREEYETLLAALRRRGG